MCETCEERLDPTYPVPIFRPDKPTNVWFVAVYAVGTNYGGPEEGGWWYDAGDVVHLEVALDEASARTRADELRLQYPYTGKRSSFGSDKEDHDVTFTDTLPRPSFPAVRPHYE